MAMNHDANQFILGALVLACAVIALMFVRFCQKSGDRLFRYFAVAFALMGINWGALAFIRQDEVRTLLYLLRLIAFLLILIGVYRKNRPEKAS
jgi:hypothetical protein